MSGICSAHQYHCEPGCAACAADIRDLLPDYDRMIAEAEAASEHTCECGFTFYKTTNTCPSCSKHHDH